MRIGILTENFVGLSGANDFLKQIICSLDKVAKTNKLQSYILIYSPVQTFDTGVKGWWSRRKFYKNTIAPFKEFKNIKKIIYHTTLPTKAIKKYKLDIVFPYTKPQSFDVPTIAYLYDCQHRYWPDFFSQEELAYRDSYFQEMVNHHKKIIVNAQTVKDDLIKFFNARAEQIFVLPYTPKIDLRFYKDYSAQIKKYNLPARYFMMSNQFWIHKDHPTALRAFAEYLKTDSNMEFIFTGAMEDYRRPQYINELKQLVQDLHIEKKVRFLGLIPKEEQLQIMKGATAVIQTTLFEGGPGGGSVWDAISLGIPVVLSDISTNKEVIGERVHFFKAQDAQDLCQKMQEVVNKHYSPIPTKDLINQSKQNMQRLGNSLVSLFKEL